jgi:hypothetical protein
MLQFLLLSRFVPFFLLLLLFFVVIYRNFFFQSFHGATGPCKEATPTKLRYITAAGSNCSSGSSTPSRSSRSMLPGGVGRRSELCKICTKPVFILERLNVAGTLLHRTCFKCARCNNQLSIANYYETEAGLYCCDMCPDEELSQAEVAEANKKLVQDHMEFSADEEDSLPESLQVDAVKQVEAVSSEAAANVVKEAVPLPECDQHEEVTTTTDNQDDKIAQLDDDKAEQLVTETEQVCLHFKLLRVRFCLHCKLFHVRFLLFCNFCNFCL